MTIWFVSRHPGAIDWVARQGIHIDRPVDHLDVSAVVCGDKVIGTLPIHMVADVCEREARYLHLEVSVPRELRGQELHAGQLRALGARLTEFWVRRCADSTCRADPGQALGQESIGPMDSGPPASGPEQLRLNTAKDQNDSAGSGSIESGGVSGSE